MRIGTWRFRSNNCVVVPKQSFQRFPLSLRLYSRSLFKMRDPNSLANIDQIITRHIDIDLAADFKKNVLHGHVELTVEALQDNVHELVVDTKDLTISNVIDPHSGNN